MCSYYSFDFVYLTWADKVRPGLFRAHRGVRECTVAGPFSLRPGSLARGSLTISKVQVAVQSTVPPWYTVTPLRKLWKGRAVTSQCTDRFTGAGHSHFSGDRTM